LVHSDELFNPEHPNAFSGKVKLLKRWFNGHPGLGAHKDTIRELTSRLKILAKCRNQYLHSILTDYDPQSQTVKMSGIKYMGKGIFRFSNHEFPLTAMTSFSDVIHKANWLLWSISEQLFTEDGMRRLKRP